MMGLPRARCVLLLALLSLAGGALGQTLTTTVAPGLTYTTERLPEGPWEVRELAAERGARYLKLDMALGMGQLRGVEPLSGIIARETAPDDLVVAAVNDDFFTMAGNPNAGMVSGLCVRRGELVTLPRERPAFVMMADGTPRIGVIETSGTVALPSGEVPLAGLNQPPVEDGLGAYTAVFGWPMAQGCVVLKVAGLPLRMDGSWQGTVTEIVPAGTERLGGPGEVLLHGEGACATALAGLKVGDRARIALQTPGLDGPVAMGAGGNLVLLRDGQIPFAASPEDPRHPRTAIGYNGERILIATVDGRQAGWSVGMTYHELARLMQRLGCTDALNLDGGGSTTAWVRGQVVNRPSDGAERRIANALLVRSTAPHGPLTQLTIAPPRVVAMSGAVVPLAISGTDDWHNPIAVKADELTVSGDRVRADLATDGLLKLCGHPGRDVLRFRRRGSGAVLAELPVRLLRSCIGLTIAPDPVQLGAGERLRLSVEGLSASGEVVAVPSEAVVWRARGRGLGIDQRGVLKARVADVNGTVAARVGPASGTASVAVAAEWVFEDFERSYRPEFETLPKTGAVTGEARVRVGRARQGTRYCQLTYDLGKAEGTRAAYLRLERPMGRALRLSLAVRSEVDTPAWVRVAVVDGDGARQTYTLAEAVDWPAWRRVFLRLPALKPPLEWESVYVVAAAGKTGRGRLDVDDLRVESIAQAHPEMDD